MYKNPIPTVDIIIEKGDRIILIRRKNEPFKGKLAIPGGYIDWGETVEHSAVREAKEETSLDVKLTNLLGVYSDPKRNPRIKTIAIVFIGKPIGGKLKANDDAADAFWFNINKIESKEFAFDHKKILTDYLKWREERKTYWSTK